MGPVALIAIAFAGWLVWTGRLQRMKASDGIALGLTLLGLVLAAKGKPFLGALPVALSVGYGLWRSRTARPAPRAKPDSLPSLQVDQARALLGLGPDADAAAIRAAHRRLIATVHPDRGGTPALAAQINAARDLLLAQHKA